MQIPPQFIERYQKLIPEGEWEEFLRLCNFPLPKSVRVNTLKIPVTEFKKRAEQNDWQLKPIPWCQEGFWIDRENRDVPLGKTLEFFAGLFYVQEAASLLPVEILDPQPNEVVLDLCAAPGSKTTQIAAKMQNRGVVVANEYNSQRAGSLIFNLEQQGCLNTLITRLDGKRIGDYLPETFDKVLVDAPCSAEGVARKDPLYFKMWSENLIQRLAGEQKQLLKSAWRSLKPGGVLVYSTCTYAPEENEAVIQELLEQFSKEVGVEEIGLKGVKFLSATSEWQGKKFDQVITRGIRMIPNFHNTEGFFVVKLKKHENTRTLEHHNNKTLKQRTSLRETILKDRKKLEYLGFLKERFDIRPTIFEDFLFTEIENVVWIKPEAYLTFKEIISIQKAGICLGKIYGLELKLTTMVAQIFGQFAAKNRINLSQNQAEELARGKDVILENNQYFKQEQGSKLVFFEEFCLGVSLLQAEGYLKNQIERKFRLAS